MHKLGKLFRFELSASLRQFVPVMIIYFILCAVFRFAMEFENVSEPIAILFVILTIIFVGMTFVIAFYPIYNAVTRFNKNLLGDEGYLMNTLPVKTSANIVAKMLSSIVITVCSVATYIIMAVIVSVGVELNDTFKEIYDSFIEPIINGFKERPLLTTEIVVCVIIGIIMCILMFYAAISIGHLFNSKRGFKAVCIYIGLFIIMVITTNAFFEGMSNSGLFDGMTSTHTLELTFLFTIIYDLIYGIIYYFITSRILTKHLNLQ